MVTVLDTPVGDPDHRPGGPAPVGGGGMALVIGGLWLAGGPAGAALGVLVAAVWYLFGGLYALAAGHVALGAVGAAALSLGVVELGLVAALLGPVALARDWRAVGAFLVAGGGCLAVLRGARAQTDSLALAALAVGAAVALSAYGLHRYQAAVTGGEGSDAAAGGVSG